MCRIYRKAGVDDIALLTRWAIDNAMDEPLGPETEETREVPQPKVHRKRVKLWRIRRSGFGQSKI
jgi:hypothetical protein